MINDIGGGTLDDLMFETIANLGVAYVLMHTRGNPQTMQYNNVSALSTQMAFRNRVLEWSNKEHDTTAIPAPAKYKNIAYKEDLGFVDFKNFKLNLKPDSKVFTDLPEFKAIPLDKIGLFVDEYRTKLPNDKEIKRFETMPAKDGNGTEILDRN